MNDGKKISNNFKLVTTGINRIIQFLGDHTGAEILNLSKHSHFENIIFVKIHIFKTAFFTKFFTVSKSIFDEIRILKISFFTKFTF